MFGINNENEPKTGNREKGCVCVISITDSQQPQMWIIISDKSIASDKSNFNFPLRKHKSLQRKSGEFMIES